MWKWLLLPLRYKEPVIHFRTLWHRPESVVPIELCCRRRNARFQHICLHTATEVKFWSQQSHPCCPNSNTGCSRKLQWSPTAHLQHAVRPHYPPSNLASLPCTLVTARSKIHSWSTFDYIHTEYSKIQTHFQDPKSWPSGHQLHRAKSLWNLLIEIPNVETARMAAARPAANVKLVSLSGRYYWYWWYKCRYIAKSDIDQLSSCIVILTMHSNPMGCIGNPSSCSCKLFVMYSGNYHREERFPILWNIRRGKPGRWGCGSLKRWLRWIRWRSLIYMCCWVRSRGSSASLFLHLDAHQRKVLGCSISFFFGSSVWAGSYPVAYLLQPVTWTRKYDGSYVAGRIAQKNTCRLYKQP